MPDDLHNLIRRCLTGEERAIVALVDLYHQSVFALCFRMLGQRQDAEDVAQETFVRMLRSLKSWDTTRPFTPWLLTIAANRCRTFLGQRQRCHSNQAFSLDSCPEPTVELGDPRGLSEEVDKALAELRREYREAFVLFHEHELSYGEIARIMDCPLGTIKTWVHRARRELIHKLQRRDVFQGYRYAVR